MKESVSLGSAFMSSAKFSDSLDQLFFLQPLCPRCSVLGFLMIPAARRSCRYCSMSLEMPIRYLHQASSSLLCALIIRCSVPTLGQTGFSASSSMMQSEVLLSLSPVPLASVCPLEVVGIQSLPCLGRPSADGVWLANGAGLPSVAGLWPAGWWLRFRLASMVCLHLHISSKSIFLFRSALAAASVSTPLLLPWIRQLVSGHWKVCSLGDGVQSRDSLDADRASFHRVFRWALAEEGSRDLVRLEHSGSA